MALAPHEDLAKQAVKTLLSTPRGKITDGCNDVILACADELRAYLAGHFLELGVTEDMVALPQLKKITGAEDISSLSPHVITNEQREKHITGKNPSSAVELLRKIAKKLPGEVATPSLFIVGGSDKKFPHPVVKSHVLNYRSRIEIITKELHLDVVNETIDREDKANDCVDAPLFRSNEAGVIESEEGGVLRVLMNAKHPALNHEQVQRTGLQEHSRNAGQKAHGGIYVVKHLRNRRQQ